VTHFLKWNLLSTFFSLLILIKIMSSGQNMTHKDLIVWQKAVVFVEKVYKLTEKMPSGELYGLTSQIRRSAVSIPSNIAEGVHVITIKNLFNFYMLPRGRVQNWRPS